MNVLSSVITYVRRIIKIPNNTQITDDLIIDYINRFWTMDVDARLQLFDLKTKYQFVTTPGVDRYNMPLYSVQTEPTNQQISFYPVYQGFTGPVMINGVPCNFSTQRTEFNNVWSSYQPNQIQVGIGDGSAGPYTFNIPLLSNFPNTPTMPQFPISSCILRGHVDMAGVISTGVNVDPPLVTPPSTYISTIPVTSVFPAVYFTSVGTDGSNVVVSDSGQFLNSNKNYGLLMTPGPAPFGNAPLTGSDPLGYTVNQNTVNYLTGVANNVTFSNPIADGAPIYAQCIFYQLGIPRAMLYYNNTMTFRAPPSSQFVVELDAYLSPAAFFSSTQAVPFAYMGEYIARGAARKILSDTGDQEQFNFYEPLFQEQEQLVWKRSQRQFTSTRTQTIYSGNSQNGYIGGNYGQTLY